MNTGLGFTETSYDSKAAYAPKIVEILENGIVIQESKQ